MVQTNKKMTEGCHDKNPAQFVGTGLFVGACAGTLQTVWRGKGYQTHIPLTIPVQMRVIGKTTMMYGALSAAYVFGSRMSGSIRNKDDFVNAGVGGALAGALMGVYKGNLLVATNITLAMGIGMAAAVYLNEGSEEHLELRKEKQRKFLRLD